MSEKNIVAFGMMIVGGIIILFNVSTLGAIIGWGLFLFGMIGLLSKEY